MATINDLIEQISNPQLQKRVKEEVCKLTKQKKFGLVYETHEPEMTLMYDAPVQVGSKVVKREDTKSKITPNKLLVVKSIRNGVATCDRLKTDESFAMKVANIVATYSISCADLICIAENGEPIYPYLKPVDSVQNAPNSDLWHSLIEADNYHALQLLAYLYPGQVDCIYIDPPYNSGAKDWKYNNDYVDGSDFYRHSKWLSMMEERLKLAKKLLNPKDSVLIVTIDEKEYTRLGCLLEELFPEARIQMVSCMVNPGGVSRHGEFSRTDEYIYVVKFGVSSPTPLKLGTDWLGGVKSTSKNKLHWDSLMRTGTSQLRNDAPSCFYPIYVSKDGKQLIGAGNSLPLDASRETVVPPKDAIAIFPIHVDGNEGNWQYSKEHMLEIQKKGYVKLGKFTPRGMAISYLKSGNQSKVENGVFHIIGHREDGSIIVDDGEYEASYIPGTQWMISLHDATRNGSNLLRKILDNKRFNFPKSLYAVHDTIRFFVANKPNALIVDFFAGSGTTLHAINLLNKEDGGNRRCIMVTNNEISAGEEETFKAKGLHKGDEEWEKFGIARYVNWPRTKCSILGIDVNDKPLEGDYISANTDEVVQKRTIKQLSLDLPEGKEGEKLRKQILQMVGKKSNTEVLFNVDKIDDFMESIDDATDTIYVVTANNKAFKDAKVALSDLPEITKSVPQKIPMRDGFKANAAFFKLGFLDKKSVDHGKQLQELMPVLWMKAGAHGVCPKDVKEGDLIVLPENKMALLIDEYEYDELLHQLAEHPEIETIYIVNDNEEEYYRLAQGVKAKHIYQLYRDYLDNFKINIAKK